MKPSDVVAKRSLLLVDSDARSVRVLEVSLKKAGFSVTSAASAAQALASALENPPDLVITDTTLPDSDGFELCWRLRADPRTARTGVVFLSADTSAETRVKGINAGADDYLAKPVLVMEIVARVRSLLEKRETEAIARRDRPGNLSGALAHMGVVDLLQLMESGQKSGIVHLASDPARSGGFVTSGEQRGTIYFRDGHVIDAHVGKLSGSRAVYRMLMWEDGVFEIEFKPLAREDVVRTTTQALLLEGMRRIDEWTRNVELLPALNTKLTVDFGALGARYRDLPERMRPLVHLFDAKRSIFEVIDEAAEDDLEMLGAIVELYRNAVLRTGDRAPQPTPPAGVQQDTASVEAWLSAPPRAPKLQSESTAPANTTTSNPSNASSAMSGIPSALARATIPSPNTPSEILAAADPRALLRIDPTEPDGTSLAPIPLTTPVRERTPVPEPLPEDSVVLSRHTVPANRAVLLTQPSKPPLAADETPAQSLVPEPIPLTQRAPQKLVIQRMSSVVGPLPQRQSIIQAVDGAAAAALASPVAASPSSSPNDDSWEPVRTVPSTRGLVPADNDPTLTDFPTMPRSVPMRTSGGSAAASAAPQMVEAHPVPAWPVAASAKSLAYDETERIVRTRDGDRAPVRGPSLIIAPTQTPPRAASAVAHSSVSSVAASSSSSHAQVQAALQATAAASSQLGAHAPIDAHMVAHSIPSGLASSLGVSVQPPPPPPASAPPLASVPAAFPESVQKTPAKLASGARSREEFGLQESFFTRQAEDEVAWEASSSRWKGLLIIALIAVVAVAVVIAPRLVTQKVEKAPLPESPAKAAKAKTETPRAVWPTADEAKIEIGTTTPQPPATDPNVAPTQPAVVAPVVAEKPVDPAKPAAADPKAVTAIDNKAAVPPVKPVEQPPAKAVPAVALEKPAEKPVEKPAVAPTEKPLEDPKKGLVQAESFLKSDKLRDAEKIFRQVLDADPNSAPARSGLAMALYGMERDGLASAEAKKAIALDNNSARAHLVLGLIASNRQDIAGAKKAYKRYLELEPKGEYAEEVRRFMKAQQ